MQALGALNPVDVIAAKIQSRIATFLTIKERLIGLINQGSISVSSKATELYTVQRVLESQLNQALNKIEVMKSGSWTLSDVASLGVFYSEMEKQIKNVQKLEEESGITITLGIDPSPQDAAKLIPWLVVGGVAAIFTVIWMRR